MQKNIVSTRSQGYPRVNDIAVNDKILGMTVQPYRIHTDVQKDDQLVTWKQISRKKDNLQIDNFVVDHNFSREFQFDLELCDREERNENRNRMEKSLSIVENNSRASDKSKDGEIDKVKNSDVMWMDGIQNLNQTYLIRDSEDIEPSEIFDKWKPIKHSPRIKFYLKGREDEICEFNQKKLRRKTVANDKETRLEQMKELKVYKNEEDDETVVVCKKKLKTNNENIENNRKMNSEEIEVITCKTEEFNVSSKDEENKQKVNYEEIEDIECTIEKIEINIEDTKETKKIDNTNVAELDRLSVYKEDEGNREVAMDVKIIESTKCTEEIERNLSEPDQITKSSSFDITHSWKNFIDQSQDYLNLKNEIPQCKSSCNNSLELKKNLVTFVCDQSNINEISSNNNNQVNSCPEDETLMCQSNSCRNSLDLTENIKEISFPASCQSISLEKNYEANAEEIEISEKSYENLTNLCNKKLKKNSKRLYSEMYSLPRNLEITANNYLNASMNNIPVHIKGNRQYQKDFSSDNFENIENVKIRRTDFNTDSDNSCSNDKSRFLGRSIIKTEVMTGEGLRNKNSEFDYVSDNTARVEEYNVRGVNDLGSSVTLTDVEEESRRRDIFLNVNFPRCPSDVTKRTARERSTNSIEMKHRIKESMNLLRDSTDSLISSVEFVELASIRRPEANCAYERETIEIIRPSKWNKVSKNLPDIKSEATEMKEERSYWEKTSKISRNRLTSLYPACRTEYKFAKRNPRVRILPPVLNPFLITRR